MGVRMICDLGGTRIRLGLVRDGVIVTSQESACADWPDLQAALRAFMTHANLSSRQDDIELVLAMAGPVGDKDMVRLTNHHWQFSRYRLQQTFSFSKIAILNDFEALALSVPLLTDKDMEVLQPAMGQKKAARLVMGAGTGFGMAGLVSDSSRQWQAVAAEGGHASLCADLPRHQDILAVLQKKYGRVQIEHILSGPGLVNLAHAMGVLYAEPHVPFTPEEILAGEREGHAFCRDVLQVFAGWLGRVCGDMALIWGARGGIYLSGGLLQGLGSTWFRDSVFLEHFCAKGAFASYLESIPVFLITYPLAAFPSLVHYRFPEGTS